MTYTLLRPTFLGLALLVLPTVGATQETPAPPTVAVETDSAASARLQGWLAEIQQINGRLQELQQQALSDPQLAAEQQALGERIRAAMAATDPTLEASMLRVQELQSEAAAAQQEGNNARLAELGTEVRQIQEKFVQAQQTALADPEISAAVEGFQERLQAKVTEIEPSTPQLIARFEELQSRLAAAMQTGG